MEDFEKKICADVIVEVVNLTRATWKEAGELKKILDEDILLKYRRIVIDINKCEFIDSTFLGSLVVSLKKLTGLGGDLRLVGFQPAVHSMFELTRMYRVFESFKTVDEAVESFK